MKSGIAVFCFLVLSSALIGCVREPDENTDGRGGESSADNPSIHHSIESVTDAMKTSFPQTKYSDSDRIMHFFGADFHGDLAAAMSMKNGVEVERIKSVVNTSRWKLDLAEIESDRIEYVLIEDMQNLQNDEILAVLQFPKLKCLELGNIPPDFDLRLVGGISALQVFSADAHDLMRNRSFNDVVFENVRSLGLYGTTDEMCKQLYRFPRLRALSLGGGPVSDVGMQFISRQHPNLESLHVAFTKIGPESLDEITSLKELRYLVLFRTPLMQLYSGDKHGIPAINELLPNCGVLYNE